MRKIVKRQVLLVVLIVIIAGLLFDIRVLSTHNWNPRAFVLETPANLPEGQMWGVGYDGRFAYHIAVNSLGSVKGLDEPNYRYQRILYPLLVKLLSFGHPVLVPWMMLLVNLLAAGIGAGILGKLLVRRHVSPWWALVLVLSIGYILAIRMDLLEPLALGLALGGLLAYEEKRHVLALILFALGGLAKEIVLLFPAALTVWELSRSNFRQAILLTGTFIPFAALYIFLAQVYGIPREAVEKSRFLLIPFSGLVYLEDTPSRILVGLWALLPALLGGLWAGWYILKMRFKTEQSRDALLVLANAGLIAIMPAPTWIDPLAILRLALGLLIALLLWFASSHKRALPYAAGLWLPSGLILVSVPGML